MLVRLWIGDQGSVGGWGGVGGVKGFSSPSSGCTSTLDTVFHGAREGFICTAVD